MNSKLEEMTSFGHMTDAGIDVLVDDKFPRTKIDSCLEAVQAGERWILERYPDVEEGLGLYAIGLKSGNTKSRIWFNRYEITLARSNWIGFYARACRDIGHGLKEHVGRYDKDLVFMTNVIHELTHAVQCVRNFHKRNETDTTRNELAWLKENKPGIFRRCFDGKAPEVFEHATIERKRRR